MIAGISPHALSLRVAERPTSVRGWALSLTCFAIFFVLDLEQRRHGLVVMYPFDPSPRSSETQSTVVLNPSTVRTGVLLVVTNSVIFDFCKRGIAISTRTACETPA